MNLYVKRYKSLNELLNYDRFHMFADSVKKPITKSVEEYLREALNNIKNLYSEQVLVLYFKINQHKKGKSLNLDGKAEDVWKGLVEDVQGLVNKVLK